MNKRLFLSGIFALTATTTSLTYAFSLANLSEKDSSTGLKQALTQGANEAVSLLGKEGGFLNNEKVKIPLPESLQKTEKILRTIGYGDRLDELVTSMNHAAEAAVPQAKSMLVDAVKQMSVQDAKEILTGNNDAATRYFRSKTEEKLTTQFLPVIKNTTSKYQLAEQYNKLAARGVGMGLVKPEEATVENYVTHKALDGLYLIIAEEEKKIRQNPMEAVGSIAKKVFGAILK